MAYEFFYSGTPYPLEPEYGELFTGYRISAGEIGAPTSIQTANQLQEVTNLLSQGGKVVELQPLSPEVFDTIPKQHFKEIERLTKLTGTETTVHAPLIDPAGFTREGWSEANREAAEKQIQSIVERSHELNPKGNMPITIHASSIPGTEYSKPSKKLVERYKKQFIEEYGREPTKEELKQLEENKIIAINQETGQLIPIKREERFYPVEVGVKTKAGKKIIPEFRTPEEELKIMNQSEWHNNLTQVLFYKNRGDEILEKYYPAVKKIWDKVVTGKIKMNQLTNAEKAALNQVYNAHEYLENSRLVLNNLFNKAYKYGNEKERAHLSEVAKSFEEKIRKKNLAITSEALQDLIREMQSVKPNIYVKVEDFAVREASKTLANTAFNAYKKYKDKAPIISIENLYPGMAFSRSDELKELVERARKKFEEKAVKEGMSRSEAKDAANKLIGVTWDVGHINMLRKAGYKPEEIKKETEKIAKLVKHVHLTDNFGYADTHLPPGMGNVPIKDILKELEKAGFKGKKIVEAGGFVQHFKVSPTQYILEAMGSPLYSAMMQPYWNQIVSSYGSYFAGYGTMLPEQHFSMYGAGFSTLPAELGGQVPGKQTRFGGTPTA